MQFTKYHIELLPDGLADVWRVNAFGWKTWLGRVPAEAIHTLFY